MDALSGTITARTACLGNTPMLADWNTLSDDLQLVLSREALRRAVETVAGQAEVLADEMEVGTLTDRGGVDALRLLAAIVRVTGQEGLGVAGHA